MKFSILVDCALYCRGVWGLERFDLSSSFDV
jgi:hypothetical protein